MMATAMLSAAAFTDDADIEALEAVNMLSALGVINGYEDGSFQPNGTVTRAEMATMLYIIRNNGRTDASGYANLPTSFTDLGVASWAQGYIKHAQTMGIISGRSDTIFDPNATVTGVEAALMCLRTAGYDADKAGIGGATWMSTTLSLANEAGLLDGVQADLYGALPRQWAAQMLYNLLNTSTVRWSNDSESFTDLDMGGNALETVGERYMNLYTDIGTITSIDGSSLTILIAANDVPDSAHGEYSSNVAQDTKVTFTSVDQNYTALMGQKVRVLTNDSKLNDVIGVYAVSERTSYTANATDVEPDGNKVKINGTSYSLEANGITAIVIDVANRQVVVNDAPISPSSSTSKWTANNFDNLEQLPQSMTFIDADGNGRLDTVLVYQYHTAKVTYVSSSQIVATNTYAFDDENIAEDIAKDDWVMISYNPYDECLDIVKAETLNDTLSSTRDTNGYDEYRIGGTWYAAAKGTGIRTDLKTVRAGDTVQATIVNGVVVAISRTSASADGDISDVAMILDIDTYLGSQQAKIALFDGTKLTVDVDDTPTGGIEEGQVYEFTVSGSDYSFETLKTGTTNYEDYYGGYTALNQSLDFNSSGSTVESITISDNADVLLYAGNDRRHITGKQFKNSYANLQNQGAAAIAMLYGDMDGLTRVRALAVSVNSLPDSDSLDTDDNYAIIIDSAVRSGTNQVEYTIWNGTDMIQVIEDYSGSLSNRQAGLVIGYSSISGDTNEIDDVSVKTMHVGRIDGRSGDTINVLTNNVVPTNRGDTSKSGEFDMNSNTVQIWINSDNDFNADRAGGDIGVPDAGDFSSSDYANILFLTDSSNEFLVFIIDVQGRFVDSPYVEDINAARLTATHDPINATFGTESAADVELTAFNIDTSNGAVDITVSGLVAGIEVTGDGSFAQNRSTATTNIAVADSVAIGTYNVVFTAGGASVTVPVTVTPKQASEEPPTHDGVAIDTRVSAILLESFTKVGDGYTITSFVIKVNGYPMTSSSDMNYTFKDGDTVTADVTVTADENYTFGGSATHTFEGVEIAVNE